MKLSDMQAIAARRTSGKWKYDSGNWEIEQEKTRNSICNFSGLDKADGTSLAGNPYDGEFIAMCSNNWNALMKFVDTVQKWCAEDPCDSYSEVLHSALKELEK